MSTICCPPGSVYVDGSGNYTDPSPIIGTGHVSNPTSSGVINACNRLVSITPNVSAFAIPTGSSTVNCLCCPSGYTYSSYTGKCVGLSSLDPAVPTVPCITCVCPPAIINTCPTCGTQGQAIVFKFDFNKKACYNCTPQDNNGPSCLDSFLPPQYIDPIINFELKNKNFI